MDRKDRKSRSISKDEMPDRVFNPKRLSFARRRRGLTKTLLSEKTKVSLRSITDYESGKSAPGDEALQCLSEPLGFPKDFFFGEELEEPTPQIASFRALTRMTSSLRDMALTQGGWAMLLNDWLEKEFVLPVCDIPNLGYEHSPESAANTLRRHWGLGELPIPNMVHLIESKGVRVFSLALNTRHVDAFSWWKGETPFVLLNNQKSSERSRYDAAHELGHLVLHRHGVPRGRDEEKEANVFASAFLMPSASVKANSKRFMKLNDLIRLKSMWTVSVAALAYRLHELEVITDWQYRILVIQIGRNGYLTREPKEAPRETSQILPKVFEDLRSRGKSRLDLGRELGIPKTDLEELLFGLTLATIEGGRKSDPNVKSPELKVVETAKR